MFNVVNSLLYAYMVAWIGVPVCMVKCARAPALGCSTRAVFTSIITRNPTAQDSQIKSLAWSLLVAIRITRRNADFEVELSSLVLVQSWYLRVRRHLQDPLPRQNRTPALPNSNSNSSFYLTLNDFQLFYDLMSDDDAAVTRMCCCAQITPAFARRLTSCRNAAAILISSISGTEDHRRMSQSGDCI